MSITYRLVIIYFLTLFLIIMACGSLNAQIKKDGIQVVQFTADFNKDNEVNWLEELKDCKIATINIGEGDWQKKYKIAIVPTIIIFDDGEEVDRFQADLSMALAATKEEVQEAINEIIMNKF
jgi:thiol-disulfide isomerase/thioredoxin